MSGSLIKQLIGKEDCAIQTSPTDLTYSRLNSVGSVITMTKFPDIWNNSPIMSINDLITKSPWVDVRAYGVKMDGVTDDWDALQTLLDITSPYLGTGENVTMLFPPGICRVTKQLTYTGGSGHRINLLGSGAVGLGGTLGSVLLYDGTLVTTTGNCDGATGIITNIPDTSNLFVNEYVMVSAGFPSPYGAYGAYVDIYRILSKTTTSITIDANSNAALAGITITKFPILFRANGGTANIRQMVFNGNFKAQIGLAIETGGYYGYSPANDWIIENSLFYGCSGTYSAQLDLGALICQQASEMKVYNSYFYGGGLNANYGVRCGIGNAKDHYFYNCDFNTLKTGIVTGNNCHIINATFGNISVSDIYQQSSLKVQGTNSEGSYRFITSPAMTASNKELVVTNCCWESSATAADDVIIDAWGEVTLIGNHFKNNRTSSSIPIIVVPTLYTIGAYGLHCSIVSINNFYYNCTRNNMPFYWSTGLKATEPQRIFSYGDTGGDASLTSTIQLDGGTYGLLNINGVRHGAVSTVPIGSYYDVKTYRKGDILWNTAPTSGGSPGWVCITSGTFSTATDNTGDTDGVTAVITGMTDTSDFNVGDYVEVSAGFPTTGPYEIIWKTATTITINVNSDAAVNNITVSTPDPIFTTMANLA